MPAQYKITKVSSQIISRKAQLRAPLSPLQTAWTSLNPYLIELSRRWFEKQP